MQLFLVPKFQSLVIETLDVKVFSLLIHQNLPVACCLLGTLLGSGYTTENKMNKASELSALQFSVEMKDQNVNR